MPTDWNTLSSTLRLDPKLATLSEEQCKALIDAMLYLIYADHEASFMEMQEFEHMLYELPWSLSEQAEVAEHVEVRARVIKGAVMGQRAGEVLEEIAAELGEPELGEHALRMAANVAYADWTHCDEEQHALITLGLALGVERSFIDTIVKDIERAHQPGDLSIQQSVPTQKIAMRFDSTGFLDGVFAEFWGTKEVESLSREERVAIVEVLTIALISDGTPTQEEVDEFRAQLERLWLLTEEPEHVEQHVRHTLEEIQLAAPHQVERFLMNAASPLIDHALRKAVLHMATKVTHADMEITQDEASLLYTLARVLKLAPQEVNASLKEARGLKDGEYVD